MTGDSTAPEPAPRTALGLIVDPIFGPYFAVKTLSSIGVWVHNVVAAVVVYQLTNSALLVGAVSVAQFMPQVLFAPLAGARADREDRVRQLVLARLTTGLGGTSLAIWIGLVGVEGLPGAWPVIGAAFVVGVGFAIGAPAMHAILPSLVRPSELSGAVALNQAPFTIARAAGPALGALLLIVAGPALAFGLAGATNLVYAWVVFRLRLRPVARIRRDDGSVRSGLRYLRTDSMCILLLFAVTAVGFGVDPVITLTPVIADQFGGGETMVGVFASAFGVGAAITVIIVGSISRRLGMLVVAPFGLTLFALGLAMLGMMWSVEVAVAGLAVAGSGLMLSITSLTTQLQQRLPEHMRGRIMALWSVAFIGSRPLAAALNGTLADYVSLQLAVFLTVGLLAIAAVMTRPSRTDR